MEAADARAPAANLAAAAELMAPFDEGADAPEARRDECEERGIDPDELMSRPARRPDELRR